MHRRLRGRLDRELQVAGKPNTAQQAELVLGEAVPGLADAANQVAVNVRAPAHKVEDLIRERVQKQAVDGKIAALRIFFGRAIPDRAGAAAIEIGFVATKRGDFKLVTGLQNQHHAEGRADRDRFGKEALHFVGRGRRGDIKVVGGDAAQHIADTTPRKVGDVSGFAEPPDNLNCSVFHSATG